MNEKIRRDFPVLQERKLIYFDSACQTLRPRQVIEKINEYYREYPACGERSMHKMGRKVTDEVQKSRAAVKKFIDAKKAEEIIFTKNTTESINIILNSLRLEKGDAIITSDKEHNSNLIPVQLLAERKGIRHKIAPSRDDNTFDTDAFQEMLGKGVKLVSIVHTSNLDGVTNPAREIAKAAHDNGSLVLLDGAQSAPHMELSMRRIDADFFAFSGHKMCGPSGTGVLYGKLHLLENLEPLISGGDTVRNSTYDSHEPEAVPARFEAGLQDYAGITGLGAAVEYLQKIGMKKIGHHCAEINAKITENLPEGISVIGPESAERRGAILSFNVKGMDSHEAAIMLDQNNIAVRSGMHCVHSWFNAKGIRGSVRASFYLYNTIEEAEEFSGALKKLVQLVK